MKRVEANPTVAELKSMGTTNIVARDMWPGAFEPYSEWSGTIFDARCKARRAAQALRETNPTQFSQIVKDTLRRAELSRLSEKQEEIETALRSRNVQ